MAAIGSIRKHGVLLMVIIGFALVLFLLTGLFDGNTLYRVFASDQYTMGKVDGENIDEQYRTTFEKSLAFMKVANQRESFTETETYQIHQYAWDQLVSGILLDKELRKLGIVFHNELTENLVSDAIASLTTEQPNQYFNAYAQYMIPYIGVENVLGFMTNIEEYKNNATFQQFYIAYKGVEEAFLLQEKMNAYLGMAQGSVYYANPLAEKLASDNQMALASLITINPSIDMFKDVNVEVTDKELKTFFEQNKFKYFAKEETRDIELVVLEITPSLEDKNNIEANMRDKFESFVSTSVIDSFNMKEMYAPLDSSFHKKGSPIMINSANGYITMNVNVLDSLIYDTPTGTVIEPYNYEDNVWFFGKSYGAAARPDSILVAYLILDHKSTANQNSTRTRKEAKAESDSLKNVILSGETSIFSLTPNYSGGRQATDTVTWYEENRVPLNLYTELINTPIGGVYIDKVNSGYIVYQVLAQTALVPKKQYALYSFDIKASDNTVNQLRATANQIFSASSSAEELITEGNSKGAQVITGEKITAMAASISNIQDCRTIVHWAFDKERKIDEISDVFKLEDRMFVIASLKKVNPKGDAKFEDIKDLITTELETKKRMEAVENMIKGDLSSSMTDIAKKYNVSVSDSVRLTFTGESYQNYGMDNMAVGKLFANPATGNREIVSGKHLIHVLSLYQIDNQPASINLVTEKNILKNILLGYSRNEMLILENMKDNADIWDNRSRFYQ